MLTVHGIGAVQRCAGPLHHLDAASLFGVAVEQLVDVTETRRAQADAVGCHEERATAAGAGQYRRAQRRQAFLAVAARYPCAGHLLHELGDVHVGGQRNGILLHGGPAQGECGSLLCVSRRRDQNFLQGKILCIYARRQERNSGYEHDHSCGVVAAHWGAPCGCAEIIASQRQSINSALEYSEYRADLLRRAPGCRRFTRMQDRTLAGIFFLGVTGNWLCKRHSPAIQGRIAGKEPPVRLPAARLPAACL